MGFVVRFFAILLILGNIPNVQAQTLKEAVCLMLEFEPELNAAEYDTLSSREDQRVARSGLFPRLTLNGSAGVSDRDRTTDGLFETGETLFQRRAGLTLRQLLYDGGTTRNQARSSRNAFLAQQHLEKSMIETRVVDLAEVYLEVLRTRRQIELAELNVQNHETMCDMLQERVRAGGSRSDLALVQGRLGLATNTLATAKLGYRLAKGRFERLTGTLPQDLSYPPIPYVPPTIDEIDLSGNHDYLASVEALEAAEFRAKSADGLNRPRLYLDGGYAVGEDVNGIRGADNEARALVVASWDIFSGGYNDALKEREHFQVGKYEELKETADLQRYYNLDVLWQEGARRFGGLC
ncbi:MAG: TolC family protein [Verrucomicrobiales bacterium]|nr:TolC family protein [Verrucomicrobiales bacterium]